MNDIKKTEADAIYNMGMTANVEPIYVRDAYGREIPAFVTPEGAKVQMFPGYAPAVLAGTYRFTEESSFVMYVNRFIEARTVLRLQDGGLMFVAVLDGHEPGSAGTETHKAELQLRLSPELDAWRKCASLWLSQAEFAEFVDEYGMYADCAPDLAAIARTLKAETRVKFESGRRMDNGDVALEFVRETKAQAGSRGDVEIPTEFAILVPFFVGSAEPTAIRVTFRYRIVEGEVRFQLEILRWERVLADERDAVRRRLAEATGLFVYA